MMLLIAEYQDQDRLNIFTNWHWIQYRLRKTSKRELECGHCVFENRGQIFVTSKSGLRGLTRDEEFGG